MNVHLTEFALSRHFDAAKSGTIITDRGSSQFLMELQSRINDDQTVLAFGYADFCILAFIPNWTNARVGAMRITEENEMYLKSGYRSRNKDELPVLSRWFEGVDAPVASYLCIVLYSKEQLNKEGTDLPDDCDYGVVAILGQSHSDEEPMQPITMMRNALGTAEGGSGVPLDQDAYQRSVGFWEDHAIYGALK